MRRPMPRRPRPAAGPARRVVIALALFIALTGMALVAFGGEVEPEAEAPTARRAEPVTRVALRHAEEAERALMDRDYGRARARVQDVRRLLANLERDRERSEANSTSQEPSE